MTAIKGKRFLEELEEQGRIGYREGEGLFRDAYSANYDRARAFLKTRMEAAGLHTHIDRVGNLFGRLEGTDRGAPTILAGSHLDSVPGGGILDGPLGIFAALEALRTLQEGGIRCRHSLEVVAFTAEEGGPLGGTFGSRAFTGQMETPPSEKALGTAGLTVEDITASKADLSRYGAYLELHIEQGPVLWKRGISIGLPTAIVGITRYRVTVEGAANHAGTTPMRERKDALYETMATLCRWIDYVREKEDLVCNVGNVEVLPNEIGVVPSEVRFAVEIRSTDEGHIADAAAKLKELLEAPGSCQAQWDLWVRKPPVALNEKLIAVLEKSCRRLDYAFIRMPSGASHDASPLARVLPTAMIFVPSVGGISHSRDEFTPKEDLLRGTTLLTRALADIDALLD